MKPIVNYRLPLFLFYLMLLSINGCSSLIAQYDKIAYQQATSLKVESLALMNKATTDFSSHKHEVENLVLKIDKAFEYAKGRQKNEMVTKQWAVMKDPSRNLIGGFFLRWKTQSSLSQVFVDEAKINISLGFDQIIGLESGKIKPKNIK